jgi:hypothetical protein
MIFIEFSLMIKTTRFTQMYEKKTTGTDFSVPRTAEMNSGTESNSNAPDPSPPPIYSPPPPLYKLPSSPSAPLSPRRRLSLLLSIAREHPRPPPRASPRWYADPFIPPRPSCFDPDLSCGSTDPILFLATDLFFLCGGDWNRCCRTTSTCSTHRRSSRSSSTRRNASSSPPTRSSWYALAFRMRELSEMVYSLVVIWESGSNCVLYFLFL